MTITASALFEDTDEVHEVVEDLSENGFPREDISVVASDTTGDKAVSEPAPPAEPADNAAEGVATSALVGGLGGFVIGLAVVAIPGVGPVLAAGPIAAALLGAAAGAVTGGLIGALMDLGFTRDEAETYLEGIRRGGTLVSVHTPDERIDEAMSILEQHDPVDLDERVTFWREEGWAGYDPETNLDANEELNRARAGS
ncbi:MAG: hypothetical protein L0332_23065 [Chloroflexi bacterium]|nr:hypothetical protein [Chloroflexota bacterium]MCI0578753.1 hypothetical protein [Chloroflexota bacterium]MCI0643962.1 hypothetical protein [Chloroflexota bacterium]MCI0729572.1 hypothetical protein [Chloroflexota bacterium]